MLVYYIIYLLNILYQIGRYSTKQYVFRKYVGELRHLVSCLVSLFPPFLRSLLLSTVKGTCMEVMYIQAESIDYFVNLKTTTVL